MLSSPSSTQLIRQEMRARGEATRPQLARACGLSLVTVNRVVARLTAAGDIEAVGEVSSGGGRPVQLYRLRRAGSWAALLRIRREATGILISTLELFDPLGAPLRHEEARFTHLEKNTLDGWLDGILHRKRRLFGITLEASGTPLSPLLGAHLAERYHSSCRRVSVADALADVREGTCTLVFPSGSVPIATLYRNGTRQPCGPLELLPLPADWATLDYSDHTLVEEMVSRLLLTLSCTLAPERFTLYGGFWSERLLRRIRYNLSTKLRGTPIPPLRFRSLSSDTALDALRQLALDDDGN